MRHLKHGRKLGRKAPHRRMMLANMATSVLQHERITTTVQKAKEARCLVERLITYGKKGTLAAVRQAAKSVKDKAVLKKLFSDIAPFYKERVGGYVRIIKAGQRKGDDATMCILELVARERKKVAPEAGGQAEAAGTKSAGKAKKAEDGEAGGEKPAKKKSVKVAKAEKAEKA